VSCFLPHPTSNRGNGWPEALRRGMRVIDLSGAWRLTDAANRAVYAFEDSERRTGSGNPGGRPSTVCPSFIAPGLQERASLPTPAAMRPPSSLALRPLVAAGLVDLSRGIVADAKSGVSGAGKGAPRPRTHFMHAADNFSAYGALHHRHTGELLEQVGIDASEIIFTPHLLPIPRGILSTIYMHSANRRTKAGIAPGL